MDRELTRAELDELLPLFALDALDGEEREQVARYVDAHAVGGEVDPDGLDALVRAITRYKATVENRPLPADEALP